MSRVVLHKICVIIVVFKNPKLSLVSVPLTATSTFPCPQQHALLPSYVSYSTFSRYYNGVIH